MELSKHLEGEERTSSVLWVSDDRGEPSVTVTLLITSFWITTLYFIVSMFTFPTSWPVQLKPYDPALVSSYFIPILTLYGHKRWSSKKYKPIQPPQE